MPRWLLGLAASLLLAASAAAQPAATDVTIPLTLIGPAGAQTVNLAAIQYRPAGPGPFPAVVISHGSPVSPEDRATVTPKYPVASEVFVGWGLVVLNPTRRGYGKTGGAWAEGYGRCDRPAFVEAGMRTTEDIAAALAYLRRQPFVDGKRIALVGQSAGGWGSLAAATRPDLRVRGIVNFAGGRGGKQRNQPNNNCAPDRLVDAAGILGKSAIVPSLWIYTQNDQFFSPELSRRMYQAYVAGGARATFQLLPAIGDDGHRLFTLKDGVPLWRAPVERFLREIGVLPPP